MLRLGAAGIAPVPKMVLSYIVTSAEREGVGTVGSILEQCSFNKVCLNV